MSEEGKQKQNKKHCRIFSYKRLQQLLADFLIQVCVPHKFFSCI